MTCWLPWPVPPRMLVLDQMLPDKPGTHVLANLRQAGWRFPVLMLSALGAPADRICGLEVGADDYLAKPFLPRELQLRLERLQQQQQPRQRQAQRLELLSEGTARIETVRGLGYRLHLESPPCP